MKFGKHLAYYKIPEWADNYLDFAALKTLIKKIKQIAKAYSSYERQLQVFLRSQSVQSVLMEDTRRYTRMQSIKEHGEKLEHPLIDEYEPIDFAPEQNEKIEQAEKKFAEYNIMVEKYKRVYKESVGAITQFYKEKITEIKIEMEEMQEKILAKLREDPKFEKTLHREKSDLGHRDELEQATSWKRVILNSLVKMQWLTSYCRINYLACQKISKKFLKTVRGYHKEKLSNELKKLMRAQEFVKMEELKSIKGKYILFFAQTYTNGNIPKAKEVIRGLTNPVRPKDICIAAFFGGLTLSLFGATVFLICLHDYTENISNVIYPLLYTFRWTFCFIIILFLAAACIYFMRKFDVNYFYIFQLDPHGRIREMQLLRVGAVFIFIWVVFLFLQILSIKFELMTSDMNIFTLLVVIILFLLMINPLHCFYRRARWALWDVIWQIIISPFGKVRFRDFFLADIFTSLVKPFQDMGYSACFFGTTAWIDNHDPQCGWLPLVLILISLLPYYWRFMQCLNKYNETQLGFPHLVNAGKYFSAIVVGIMNLINLVSHPNNNYYAMTYVVSTVYCYIWDLTMDWGLLRGSEHPLLRPEEKMLYPHSWYYFAMISNLFLRFAWTLTMVPVAFFRINPTGSHFLIFLLSVAEIYRRSQWALFRVENENVNNFEKYRSILEIPKLSDEEIAQKIQRIMVYMVNDQCCYFIYLCLVLLMG